MSKTWMLMSPQEGKTHRRKKKQKSVLETIKQCSNKKKGLDIVEANPWVEELGSDEVRCLDIAQRKLFEQPPTNAESYSF